MQSMSKATLARHVTLPHGGVSIAMPVESLRRWSREELETIHQNLIGYGPCPSFRDEIRTKS